MIHLKLEIDMKVKNISKVNGPLAIRDPFILASTISDVYPKGNGKMAPEYYLPNRNPGADFAPNLPWRMYHGDTIPGFPQHPHRGFEIVTIVPEGYADHFDSKGSKGRYGNGDAQLMSVGSGVIHSEMFPLLDDEKENPFRLFQIWVNLPSKSKLTDPEYKMLWNEKIPVAIDKDQNGNEVKVKVIVGEYNGVKALGTLKHSWAADPKNNMGIALVEMDANTVFTLPAKSATMNRFVLYYEGNDVVEVDGYKMQTNFLADLGGNEAITIKSGKGSAKLLILEGEPINEPVAAHGPFVMNTQRELQEAFAEYQRTGFGGWPWGKKESDIVNPKDARRFASYDFDKVVERPE